MWDIIAVCAVAFFFGLYAFFDNLTICARVAGSLEGRNALGASFEKAMNTIKRGFMFLYPPILGALISFGRYEVVYVAIFVSCFIALLISISGIVFMQPLVNWMRRSIRSYVVENSLARSIIFPCKTSILSVSSDDIGRSGIFGIISENKKIFGYSCWVYFVYSSAIFVVNIIAIEFSQYSAVIFQSIGAYNALGKILLAFIVDPLISNHLDDGRGVQEVAKSVLAAQSFVCGIICPIFFVFLISGLRYL